ncbi:dolichyl-phosphate beta-D-mannosyltransferase [Thermogladius calderae 1633]|uniref:Dolichyl-phosphate beta-D-mannosyltransferase n=1 Tax=Thermogladius calderae (strain DSM 22663 / VKM B-2946 / 1633) TaxID=1184251 RepID=I3TCE1_THEC1|nr:GtrA family protein [Thermogladius calderae]AFK50429.1 dolichyl-phosphate beta-D-mannosyltransferase [Thermogladius calderae 1633]
MSAIRAPIKVVKVDCSQKRGLDGPEDGQSSLFHSGGVAEKVLLLAEFVSERDAVKIAEMLSTITEDATIIVRAVSPLKPVCDSLGAGSVKGVVGVYGDPRDVFGFIGKPGSVTKNLGVVYVDYKVDMSTLYSYIVGKLPSPLKMLLKEPLRLFKFGFVGFTGTLVNLLVASLLYYLGIANAILSTFVGFEASTLWNFNLHEHWTFGDLAKQKPHRVFGRLLKFHVSSVASLITQLFLVYLGTVVFGVNYTVSLLAGIVTGFAANYMISRYYAWK